MTHKEVTQDNIVVSVFMLTYLHADYIKQAINGVLIQECDFPIELIVADDRSPDNTEEVVREFLKDHPKKHLVKYTRHEENKGMHGNFQWMTDIARGKYIAQCEGDDYWTDPSKLQKQIDFLEKNPDYGLVYTKAKIYEDKTDTFWKRSLGSALTPTEVLYKNLIPSLTTVYRSDLNQLYLKENREIRSNWKMGDYPKWIWFFHNSKVYFIDEITAVWRKLENSASNYVDVKKKMAFKNNAIKIQTYFGKKYLNQSDFLKLRNHLLFDYYYTAMIVNPGDISVYYDEIKESEDLYRSTKLKLFALQKLNLKQVYYLWIRVKKLLRTFLPR